MYTETPKTGIYSPNSLRYGITPSSIGRTDLDPEYEAWLAGITAASSTMSPTDKDHVLSFVNGCISDATWSKLVEVNLFAKVGNLTSALVKLKAKTTRNCVQFNMTDGTNYVDSGASAGIVNTASNTYLDSTETEVSINPNIHGIYAVFSRTTPGSSLHAPYGTTGTTPGIGMAVNQSFYTGGSLPVWGFVSGNLNSDSPATSSGLNYMATTHNGTIRRIFVNGVFNVSATIANVTPNGSYTWKHICHAAGTYSPGGLSIKFGCIKTVMTDAEELLLHNRVSTLMTNLGVI